MSPFIIVSPIARLGFGTSSVLFPTLITFYMVYCVFEIAINVINFVRISLFEK